MEVDALFSLLLPASDRNRDDRMLGYDAAHVLARLLLDRGQMPVLECTYSRRQQRASLMQAFADVPDAPVHVVEVAVAPDDAVLRFRRRHQATDLDEQLVHDRARNFPYSDQALLLVSAGVSPDDPGAADHDLAAAPARTRRPGAVGRGGEGLGLRLRRLLGVASAASAGCDLQQWMARFSQRHTSARLAQHPGSCP